MAKHFIFHMVSTFWSLLVATSILLAYGYVEAFSQRGYVVTLTFGLYLVWKCKYFLLPLIFATMHMLAVSSHPEFRINSARNQEIRLGSFAILILISLFLEQREEDDTIVKFRPYEEEIRQFLLDTEPALLSRVDSLLVKYKGKEKQLLQKLKAKYSNGGSSSFSSPLKSP